MPLPDYDLRRERDGLTMPLTEWGVRAATRTIRHARTDTLTLELAGNSIAAASPLLPREDVSLLRDGVRRFFGTVQTSRAAGTGGVESRTLECVGPWEALERIIYQQTARVIVNPSDADPGLPYGLLSTTWGANPTQQAAAVNANVAAGLNSINWPLENHPIPTAIIGASDDGAGFVTGRRALEQALEYAQTVGAGFAFDASNLGPLVYALNNGAWEIPAEQVSSASVAEVIRRVLRYRPDVTCWWDYAAATPLLVFSRRSTMTQRTIVIGGPIYVGAVDITRRADLEIDAVSLNYQRSLVQRYGTQAQSFGALEVQSAGIPTGLRSLLLAFQFEAITRDAATQAQTGRGIPQGLADILFGALSLPQWEGSLTTVAQDAEVFDWISRAWSITGGPAEWIDARMLCTQAVDVLETGRTTLSFSTPDLSDLRQLQTATRAQEPSSSEALDIRFGGWSVFGDSRYPGANAPGAVSLDGVPDYPGVAGSSSGTPRAGFAWGDPPALGGSDVELTIGTVLTPVEFFGVGTSITSTNPPGGAPAAPDFLPFGDLPALTGPTGATVTPFMHEVRRLKIIYWPVVGGAPGPAWAQADLPLRRVQRGSLDLRNYRRSVYRRALLVGTVEDIFSPGSFMGWTMDVTSYLSARAPGYELPLPPLFVHDYADTPTFNRETHTRLRATHLRLYAQPAA